MRVRMVGWIWLLTLVLSACTLRPRGVLSSSKMVDVLTDLHVADGVCREMGYHYGHEEEVDACYSSVLAKHHVTQAEFDSSLVWYTDHPLHFNRIYPQVLKRLERDRKYYVALEEVSRPNTIPSTTSSELHGRSPEEWIFHESFPAMWCDDVANSQKDTLLCPFIEK